MKQQIFVLLFALFAIQSSSYGDIARNLDKPFNNYSRKGWFGAAPSIGFSISPNTFLLGGTFEYFLRDDFSIGIFTQSGVSDSKVFTAPTWSFKYTQVVSKEEPILSRIMPNIHAGIGALFLYYDHYAIKKTEKAVGGLFNVGFGTDFFLTDFFSLFLELNFNISTNTLGQKFFYSNGAGGRFIF